MCGAEKVRHMLMGEQVLKKWEKSKKMTVAFGGILVMSVVIGGCGGREDAKKSIKIGISVYDQYDTFVSEMMKDFNDYATKKKKRRVLRSISTLTMHRQASRRRTVRLKT